MKGSFAVISMPFKDNGNVDFDLRQHKQAITRRA
jgi:dihydrodipicolinate synthase/N-acetylneuraminate lyase